MKLKLNDVVTFNWKFHHHGITTRRTPGVVGFITEFNAERTIALVQPFNLKGELVPKHGWVPVILLEMVHDPSWLEAMVKVRLFIQRCLREAERWERQRQSNIERVAIKLGITTQTVEQIVADLQTADY
ncbi:MAG TPA: hypothetical protein VGG19_14905 [Tepidisphaeraceae bacterium]|jgi:hypothetical protein